MSRDYFDDLATILTNRIADAVEQRLKKVLAENLPSTLESAKPEPAKPEPAKPEPAKPEVNVVKMREIARRVATEQGVDRVKALLDEALPGATQLSQVCELPEAAQRFSSLCQEALSS